MFEKNKYLLSRKILTIFGGEFQITDEEDNLVLYAKQKAFKIREDIRLFSDRSMRDEVFNIRARSIIDFSAAYDVFDTKNGDEFIGTLKRKGFNSILRDEWIIMNEKGEEIGKVTEDSLFLALMRRIVSNYIPISIPQNYDVFIGDEKVMDIKGRFNPFVFKTDLIFEGGGFDKRLGLSLAVLLGAVEGTDG